MCDHAHYIIKAAYPVRINEGKHRPTAMDRRRHHPWHKRPWGPSSQAWSVPS